jgi:GT2 family glycosyltransferase
MIKQNKNPLLSIIIVNYKTPQLTIETIESVYSSLDENSFLKNNFEIILVDNKSGDDSLKQFEKLKFDNLKIIASQNNLGFSYGNNIGLKKTKGEYLLLLNSDTIVLKKSLERFLTFFKENEKKLSLGSLAFDLLNSDNTQQNQGGDLPTLLSLFFHWSLLAKIPFLKKILPATQKNTSLYPLAEKISFQNKKYQQIIYQQKGWIGGTAILFSKKTLEKVGLWDEKIFMYGEDVDWCYRLRQNSLHCGILKNCFIIHLGSQSSGKKSALLGEIKGYIYFYKKHKNKSQLKFCQLILRLGVNLRIFLFQIKNNPKAQTYREIKKELF